METLHMIWDWWRGIGTPAAAIQQLFFIVLTSTATAVALINLSTWKRQLKAGARNAAVKEVLDAAALVCDHILIERLSPKPMVVFKSLEGFGDKWLERASKMISGELEYWAKQKAELDSRLTALRVSIERNSHLVGRMTQSAGPLQEQVSKYLKAIDERTAFIQACRKASTEREYQKMVSLAHLSKRHPLLWRRNLESLEFEETVRRSIDDLRADLLKGS
jgi:hypothetical protein